MLKGASSPSDAAGVERGGERERERLRSHFFALVTRFLTLIKVTIAGVERGEETLYKELRFCFCNLVIAIAP